MSELKKIADRIRTRAHVLQQHHRAGNLTSAMLMRQVEGLLADADQIDPVLPAGNVVALPMKPKPLNLGDDGLRVTSDNLKPDTLSAISWPGDDGGSAA